MNKEIKLSFNEIDCIQCAKEIEEEINKINGINKANIDYLNKYIIISYDNEIYNKEEALIDVINNNILVKDEEVEFFNISNNIIDNNKKFNLNKLLFIIGTFIGILAIVFYFLNIFNILNKVLFVIAYILIGYKILIIAIKNIFKGKFFDENFLMTLSSILAISIGDFFEAWGLIFLYRIGEAIQDLAVSKTTNKIASISNLNIDKATKTSGEIVHPNELKKDDEIVVNKGERIAIDGIIIKGNTYLDLQSLTGESIPIYKKEQDEVLSGSINIGDSIIVKVVNEYQYSKVSKISKILDEATLNKSKIENFITKFSKIYTPSVIIIAVFVFLIQWLVIKSINIDQALLNSIIFLVSSCPCALLISVPLAVYAGIGKCSKQGVLVKGGYYLEALAKTKTICFDKTGTLTKGNLQVVDVIFETNDESLQALLLNLCYSIEKYSNHPISTAIRNYQKCVELDISSVEEIPGVGLKGIYLEKELLVGNKEVLNNISNNINTNNILSTTCFVVYDHKLLGYYLINDVLKEDVKDTINYLKKEHISSIIISGDNKASVSSSATILGIKDFYYELLPDEKYQLLKELITNKKKYTNICYVGDGINDTPCIKLADIGISIAGYGHDEAMSLSDIVIMSNNLLPLYETIKVSKFTRKITIENVIISLLIKTLVLIPAALAIIPSWVMFLGVFADVGVCLICIINSLRIMFKKNRG